MAQVDQAYARIAQDTAFARTSPNPMDKRLDFCAYFLALIDTLHLRGESFDTIRGLCLSITHQYVQPRNRLHGVVKRWIPRLITTGVGRWFVDKLHRRVSVNPNPEGFIARIITDKAQTFGLGYGVDILECGICKLFARHGYANYASILCEVDEVTSSLAGLDLIRSGTIALGAPRCDFRYRRKLARS